MRGFFTKEKPIKIAKNKQAKDPCEVCGLYKTCQTPKMEYAGKGKRKILIVCEAPGQDEDEVSGEPLTGEAGQLLDKHLRKYCNINMRRDCWMINSVNCRPPGNKTPTKKEIACCRPRVEQVVQELKPKIILLFGGPAIESFYNKRFSNLAISRWRGLIAPDKVNDAWIIANFHPSYILRKKDNHLSSTFKRDLRFTAKQLNRDRPTFPDYSQQVKSLYEEDEVHDYLTYLLKQKKVLMAHDYETSSLKPFGALQRIWTIGACIENEAVAFPFAYPHWSREFYEEIFELWGNILLSPRIKKIAHNLKFEDNWGRVIFKVPVIRGWKWCSMNAAHLIDERKFFTGLKFQAYLHFGADPNYGDAIKPYLKIPPGKSINTVDQYPLEDVLEYNGLDALFTAMLYKKQIRTLLKPLEPRKSAYKLFHDGLIALADAQLEGIPVDELYYQENYDKLGKRIQLIEKKILGSKEAKKFEAKTGNPLSLKKDISSKDLRTLLFDIMKIKSIKKTDSGLASVDKDVLDQIDTTFTRLIKKRRRLFKIRNTYLSQFIREVHNGKINPFFDLHIPRSFRSSSSNPNFQNIPVREEQAKALVRKGVVPSPAFKLVFADYGSMEVRIIACYTKDKKLISYINDPTTDMHRDKAMEIFKLNKNQVTKTLRFYAKNQFVFPEFYGSWYVSCAGNLWDSCIDLETNEGVPVKEHLKSKGIISPHDNKRISVKRWSGRKITMLEQQYNFENHIKKVEKKFWHDFPQVKEWQEKSFESYVKKGYIETKFGHRRGGFLTKNQIVNTPIQATAFHCLLWAFTKLNDYSRANWVYTRLIGQIHDEIIWNMHPSEQAEVYAATEDFMSIKIRDRFDWIIVPLAIEVEETPIDGSWFFKKEIDIHADSTT